MAESNANKCTPTKAPLHIRTPLVESVALSELCGHRKVLLKLENTQPSGSFKIRGIGHLIQTKMQEGSVCSVVSSSGGNAGMAAAYAARQLGVPATVVLPSSTPPMMTSRLTQLRAQVMVHGSIWDDSNKKALELAEQDGVLYVHPFHHPLIWRGVSSLVGELLEQWNETPSCIVLSVGGGGLLCGVLEGLIDAGLGSSVPVVAMETVGANCFNAAVAAGKPVCIGNITSLATSLGALTVTDRVFDLLPRCQVFSRVVTDAQAVEACALFLDEHRHLVEPSCGTALAGVYSGVVQRLQQEGQLKGDGPVVVVVCGGNAVTADILHKYTLKTRAETSDHGKC